MKKDPSKYKSTISAVNQIPFADAVAYVRLDYKNSNEEEMAAKLGISVELFGAYLRGEELAPEDLSPRLLGAYKIAIVRGSVVTVSTVQPPSPPEPPECLND